MDIKQVVDGFADCNYIKDPAGNVIGVTNDPINKPFCHLIDPNWVLKAPASKCNSLAYGPNLIFPGAPSRAQECVDITSCVAYDKDGNCSTQGYCTREKNSWRIGAPQCDSQNRTCRTFQDSAGKSVSYLHRTLDTGFCNQDNTGCAAYSLKKDASGNWTGYSSADLDIEKIPPFISTVKFPEIVPPMPTAVLCSKPPVLTPPRRGKLIFICAKRRIICHAMTQIPAHRP